MKILTPKSYRIKHEILNFLCIERMKNGGLNNPESHRYTIKEISEKLGYSFNDVNNNLDYLYYKKYIHTINNDEEPTNPYCYALDKGVESNSFKEIINKGKELNSSVFNNFTSGFIQIVTGLIAISTFIIGLVKIKHQEEQIGILKKRLKQVEQQQIELTKQYSDLNNAFDKMKAYQTNTQSADKEKDISKTE